MEKTRDKHVGMVMVASGDMRGRRDEGITCHTTVSAASFRIMCYDWGSI